MKNNNQLESIRSEYKSLRNANARKLVSEYFENFQGNYENVDFSVFRLMLDARDFETLTFWGNAISDAGFPLGNAALYFALLNQGKPEEALEYLVTGSDRGSATCTDLLSQYLWGKGDKTGSIQKLRTMVENGFELYRITLAERLKSVGETSEALKVITALADTGDVDANIVKADLLLELGHLQDANRVLTSLEQLNPDDDQVLFLLGKLHFSAGDSKKGSSYLKRSAERNNSDALMELGALLKDAGDFKQAELALKKAIELGNADALAEYGGLKALNQDYASAEKHIRKALESGARVVNKIPLAIAIYNQGRTSEAKELLAEILTTKNLEIFDLNRAVRILATIAEDEGRFRDALRLLDRCQEPIQVSLLLQKAEIYMKLNLSTEAEAIYLDLAKSNNEPLAMSGLMLLYQERNNQNDAKFWAEKACMAGVEPACGVAAAIYDIEGKHTEAGFWRERQNKLKGRN